MWHVYVLRPSLNQHVEENTRQTPKSTKTVVNMFDSCISADWKEEKVTSGQFSNKYGIPTAFLSVCFMCQHSESDNKTDPSLDNTRLSKHTLQPTQQCYKHKQQ